MTIILGQEDNISALCVRDSVLFSFFLLLPVTSSLLRCLVSDKWHDPLKETLPPSGPGSWELQLLPSPALGLAREDVN